LGSKRFRRVLDSFSATTVGCSNALGALEAALVGERTDLWKELESVGQY
jgi:hypothetical protein